MTETADVQSGATGRHLLSLAAEIATATSVESVASSAIEILEERFEEPVAALWQTDGETAAVVELSTAASGLADYPPSSVPEPSDRLTEVSRDSEPATLADATIRLKNGNDPLSEELVVPVAGFGVLCVGWTESGTALSTTRVVLAEIAMLVAAAISRIDREVTAEANRELRDRVTSQKTDTESIDEILSLGCDYFDADSGVLSRTSGGSCEVEGVSGDTGLAEPGDRFDYHDSVCAQSVADSDGETIGVANIADSEHNPHPILDDEGAYIGTPVYVDGERYGIVDFVSGRPRDTPFRPNEREFAGVIAQYLGSAIEQARRRTERQRYETILDTVVDPVYALDDSGQFTYVNDAAARQFGYGSDVIGEHPSIGMEQADIERVRADIQRLRRTDDQSVRHVFDLETPDGDSRIVENHLTLVEADTVGGIAGVLRDITQRERQRRQYREFKRAVEAAADGIAIVEDGEFVFVDETHVEMYGYGDKSELLGETWHTLYGDSEVTRLETEAFPALAEHGTWKGLVTGSRPNGSTFPASLSLTRLDDERLVCTVRDETEKQRRQRELELKERAMDEASVAIQITDATRDDNPLLYVNDHFESVTGYAREDALGRNPRFLQGSGTDPETVSRLRTAIAEYEPVSVEIKNYRNDGTPYWCQLSVTPIYDDDGAVVNYVGIQQDRTERRARERAVTESRERYETLLQAAPDPVFIADAETGEIVETNTAAAELLGYHREEIVGLHQSALHPESDADLYREGFQRAVEHSETVSKLPDGSQLHVVTASGGKIPVEIGVRTVSLPDGPVIYGVFRDITERRERERELELKERAMDEASVAIQIADATQEDNPLTYVNDQFEAFTGYPREEALGRNPRFLQGPETDSLVAEQLRTAIAEDESVTVEIKNYRKDGTPYWSRLSVTPIFDDDGAVSNYIGIQQDVTDRRDRTERLRDQRERLDLVLSETETGLMEWDVQRDRLTCNDTLQQLLGCEMDSLEGFKQRVHPDDRDRLETGFEALLRIGDPWTGEFRIDVEDDERLWLRTRNVAMFDDSGPVRVLSTVRDITAQKRQQRERERRQQMLELVLSTTDTTIAELNPDTGALMWDDAIGDNDIGSPETTAAFLNWLHPDDRARFGAALEALQTTGTPLDGEYRLVRETGAVEWLDAQAVLGPPVDGAPRIVASATNITEAKERERELELKERAMDEANVGITISDPNRDDNPLIYVNEGFVEQTGYSRQEVLETNCRFLQGDDRDQGGLERLRDGIGDEDPVTVDLRNYRKDGTQYWNRLSVTPVYDDGDLVNYIGIQQDVTEEKIRQRRLKALQQTATDLLNTDEKEEAITVAFEAVQADLEIEIAGAYLCEEDSLVRTVTTDETDANAPERVERGVTPLWEPLENGDPVFYEPTDGLAHTKEGGISLGLFPIGTHGVFIIGTTDERGLNASERQFVEILLSDLESVLDTIQRQKELFEEREQFRHLTESVEEYGFLVADEDGDIAIWNDGAAALFGYDEDDAVGMCLSALHTASARESERTTRLLQQARIGGESAHEGWLVREDGSEFYADVRYAPLGADADIVSGYAVIVRDMTARRNQRRRTERFVEESTDVVSVLDTDGTLTYVSGSVNRIFGYEPDTLVGENLFDYIHPESQEHAMEVFYGCVDGSDGAYQAECRFQAADGEWRNVDGQCRNLVDDDAIEGILLYLRDVTETKQRARRFESIFNQTFQFTGLLNPDGTVLEANEATFDLGGFERESIIGDPIWEAPWFSHSETAQTRARDACGRAARGQFSRYETDVSGSDGIKTIDFSLKPVTNDDDEVTLLVAEGRDITEHQQRRQHLTVLERVLRHNIRNDLTVLRGWTEQLRDEAEPAKRAAMYGTVKRILDKWESMTKRTAQIRQILEVEASPMDATTLLEDTSDWARSQYPDATIEVDAGDVDNTAVLAVVSEAVRELIDNAVSAAARDPKINLMLAQPSEDWVELVVTDTGPGLPDTEVDVLETGEETQLRHGQGLGLWMVRMVVRQTGGNITVMVTETGTTVRLRIPTV